MSRTSANPFKVYCNCPRCRAANKFENKDRPRRWLPPHVREEINQKEFKKQEEMLLKGYIMLECPVCHHRAYSKIRPVMTCTCCCAVIK